MLIAAIVAKHPCAEINLLPKKQLCQNSRRNWPLDSTGALIIPIGTSLLQHGYRRGRSPSFRIVGLVVMFGSGVGCWWGVVGGGSGERGGRIVAASEMLRPSVEACSASRRDAPSLQKVV
eukprot:CCRYP_010602-RA/>CCRYP_010602-RA protein AED:0.44 eAED:0.64 QI:0/0/0.5/1/0/0/2/159/119